MRLEKGFETIVNFKFAIFSGHTIIHHSSQPTASQIFYQILFEVALEFMGFISYSPDPTTNFQHIHFMNFHEFFQQNCLFIVALKSRTTDSQ